MTQGAESARDVLRRARRFFQPVIGGQRLVSSQIKLRTQRGVGRLPFGKPRLRCAQVHMRPTRARKNMRIADGIEMAGDIAQPLERT